VGTEELLKQRLSAVGEVVFALLFGSSAKGTSRPDSDQDIGVYLVDHLSPKMRLGVRLRLLAEWEDLSPVDVVVLNDAPPLLAQRALQGRRILVKEPSVFVRFFVDTQAKAGDERFWLALHAAARGRRLEERRFGRP
jgi:predicted nucleotidyltransferase